MSDILKGLKPERVFHYFEEICAIPHGSGNVEAISDYCVAFAKSHDLWVKQDDAKNVIIRKPASSGYENAPVVMLQGHMDMVCEKNSDVDFDFENEGLKLRVIDDMIYATGTTLGADDGIAVALAFAILEDETLSHPELEVVITTDEEVGMTGAHALDTSDLKAKYMINIDNEQEGQILTSCAGGMRSRIQMPIRYVKWEGIPVTLKVNGLKGGHSGVEIQMGRANSNRLLGRFLFELFKVMNVGVCEVSGGMKENAIPREAEALVVIQPDMLTILEEVTKNFMADLKDEFGVADPCVNVEFIIEDTESRNMNIIHPVDMERILFVYIQSINGIQTMSMELPGLVESSLNLGVVSTEADYVEFSWALRSSKKSLKYLMSDKLQYLAEFVGGAYEYTSEYPHWSFRQDSKIRQITVQSYKELFGKEPEIAAIHAGLECGLFSEKMSDLDIISIGPDSIDIHTPDEHVSISSVERNYRLLCDVLARIKD